MGKIDKLIKRLKANPKDFTWDELLKILAHYGYYELNSKGKTGGSRRKFVNDHKKVICLHEPHPEKTIKRYVIKLVREQIGI